MHAILDFAQFIVQNLLGLLVWIVIAYVILGWLIAFNVVNTRNNAVWQISRFLESVTRPLLAPFRRILPNMGGLDFSAVLLVLVLTGIERILVPAFFNFLHSLIGGGLPVI